MYENKEYELKEKMKIENRNNEKIEIKLKGIINITNMSYLFAECKNLIELPNIHLINTEFITNMSYMFY